MLELAVVVKRVDAQFRADRARDILAGRIAMPSETFAWSPCPSDAKLDVLDPAPLSPPVMPSLVKPATSLEHVHRVWDLGQALAYGTRAADSDVCSAYLFAMGLFRCITAPDHLPAVRAYVLCLCTVCCVRCVRWL